MNLSTNGSQKMTEASFSTNHRVAETLPTHSRKRKDIKSTTSAANSSKKRKTKSKGWGNHT